jgi:neuronal cell adhesion protein
MQPMPKIEQNGPDFKYIITYVRADTSDAQPIVTTVQQPDAWHYVAPQRDLGIYVPYRITVKAANSRGDSSASLIPVIGYTGEDGNFFSIQL